jgi:transposase
MRAKTKVVIVETISGYSERKVYQIFKDSKFTGEQYSLLKTATNAHPRAEVDLMD